MPILPIAERIARALYPVAFQFPPGHRRRAQAMERAGVVVEVLRRDQQATEAALRWAVGEARKSAGEALEIPAEHAEAVAAAEAKGN